MKRKLTRVSLFRSLEKVANRLSEHRNIKAPNYKYPIASATFTAFGAFYFHHPSLRSHEMTLEQKVYQSNFKKLFHREPIFCSQTVRNILDPISERAFIPAFDDIFSKLDRSGVLGNLTFSDQMGLLLSGDGVDYFASKEISCGNCSYAEHKQENGEIRTVYTHKMFNVGIVHPSENLFFPLAPEFITPQDGHKKQDCEKNAAKRWLHSFRKRHKTVRATFQVDALHCNHEFLTDVKKHRFHFIATCKKGSNKTLYDWIEMARSGGDIHVLEESKIIKGKKVLFRYEYLNNIPIRDTEDALRVNFVSVREIDQKSGKQSQSFEYVTDFSIKETNIKQLALAGRKRWKVENEGHNILKNQGYYFDRNYGHGKKHLSAVIAMLILFSFLVHAILRYIGQDGMAILFEKCHARKACIELLRHMMQIMPVKGWEELYLFSMKALQKS